MVFNFFSFFFLKNLKERRENLPLIELTDGVNGGGR